MPTLPAGTISAEREMSSLKFIKNGLQASQSNRKLNDFGILHNGRNVADKLDFDKLTAVFATKKVKTVIFQSCVFFQKFAQNCIF